MVRTDALRDFRELVTSLGGDPVALLEGAGIEPSLLESGSGKDSLQPDDATVRSAPRRSSTCPDFGMRLATVQAAQGATKVLGPLDVAMRNSPTLGEAFRYCADHLHVVQQRGADLLREASGRSESVHAVRDLLVGAAASASGRRARAGTDAAWNPCDQRRSGARARGLVYPRAACAAVGVSQPISTRRSASARA